MGCGASKSAPTVIIASHGSSDKLQVNGESMSPLGIPINPLRGSDSLKKSGLKERRRSSKRLEGADWIQQVDWSTVGRQYDDSVDLKKASMSINTKELMTNTFFSQFEEPLKTKIYSKMTFEKFRPGQDIIVQGQRGSTLYIICDGEAVITKSIGGIKHVVTHLHAGQHFGELAILFGNKRVASVTASAPTTCLLLTKEDLDLFPDVRRFLLLQKMPILASLSNEDKKAICDVVVPQEFQDGDVVIQQGTPGDNFYIMSSGIAVVTETDTVQHREKILIKLYEGAMFGEMALLDGTVRSSSVKAEGIVQCMVLNKDAFNRLINTTGLGKIVRERYERTKTTRMNRRSLDGSHINLTNADSAGTARATIESRNLQKQKNDKGQKMVNDYVIIKLLGHGSYGKVSLVENVKTNEKFAMKVVTKQQRKETLLSPKNRDKAEQENLLNEVIILKELKHPNIVRLVEVIDDPSSERIYLIQEYAEKGPIVAGLDVCVPLPNEKARKYCRDIIRGIEYLHYKGIVHRDIKPANLLVSSKDVVKIADFGVARTFADGTTNAVPKGTPAFMAPELLALTGPAAIDPIVDVWSLGATLYMLVVGHPPWMAPTWPELAKLVQNQGLVFSDGHDGADLDPALKNLLGRILTKDSKKRANLKEVMSHEWVTNEGTEPLIPMYLGLALDRDVDSNGNSYNDMLLNGRAQKKATKIKSSSSGEEEDNNDRKSSDDDEEQEEQERDSDADSESQSSDVRNVNDGDLFTEDDDGGTNPMDSPISGESRDYWAESQAALAAMEADANLSDSDASGGYQSPGSASSPVSRTPRLHVSVSTPRARVTRNMSMSGESTPRRIGGGGATPRRQTTFAGSFTPRIAGLAGGGGGEGGGGFTPRSSTPRLGGSTPRAVKSRMDALQPLPDGFPYCRTLKTPMKDGGECVELTARFGTAVRQGRRPYMEDRIVAVNDLCAQALLTHGVMTDDLGKLGFFAVYDGHGGDSTVEMLKDHFHIILLKTLLELRQQAKVTNEEIEMEQVFLQAANLLDKRLLEQDKIRERERKETKALIRTKTSKMSAGNSSHSSGSTASVVLIEPNVCHVSWVGDSRIVLSREGKVVNLTEDHTVSLPRERDRVIAAGGEIINERLFGDIRVSRCFGDLRHKLTKALTCDMEYKLIPVTSEDEFIVIASDGIWDVLSSQEVVNFVRRKLIETKDPQYTAHALMLKADELGTFDNTSAVIVALNQIF